ncbi:hypothetical protein L21SP2_1677 [Salinispira pacifica]|uniref:Uncharacterized protein n=1 Tax=Salinispira pacifica TaxID=1307761 RepID=V5WHI0_9SPIO|nr:hypothetical protein L21SP2_1677 [Salinispira pacifica]
MLRQIRESRIHKKCHPYLNEDGDLTPVTAAEKYPIAGFTWAGLIWTGLTGS